jgi:hypothetical protein
MKTTARLTGFLYFIFAALAIYDYMFAAPQIMVSNNIAASMKNMVAKEFLLRTTIMGSIISNILFAVVVLLFYQMLKQVNQFQARWMVTLVMVALPAAFINDAIYLTALKIAKGDLLITFSSEQKEAIAGTLLKIRTYSHQLVTFHWGLWLIPLAILFYQSGLIPKIFTWLLLINAAGYMMISVTNILFPEASPAVMKMVYPTWFAGEVPLIFWLMIKGVKTNKAVLKAEEQ